MKSASSARSSSMMKCSRSANLPATSCCTNRRAASAQRSIRTQPTTKLPKIYYVETEQEIGEHYVAKFAEGFYFAFEDLTTQPARLTLLDTHRARLSIVEGRYHQVKRMFGFYDNKVMRLHRESMGPLALDPALEPGEYRPLTAEEIQLI